MKEHLIRLFDYHRYANKLMLKSIEEAGRPARPVQLMAHLLVTQQTWLARCQYQSLQGYSIWPDWSADLFAGLIKKNNTAWLRQLEMMPEANFVEIISYQNSKGEAFVNSFTDIATHVINHGTHHRAQIGQLLKLDGLEQLPPTDYIFYLRDHKTA